MSPKSPNESTVTLTQLMGVPESNHLGNVHGGVLMRICDEAGALAAMKHAGKICVTVAVDRMTFDAPVRLGNLVSFEARVTWVGRTSIEAQIIVRAEDVRAGKIVDTNMAHFVYVALNSLGRPAQVPPLLLETDEDRRLHKAAEARQDMRLKLREQAEADG